MERLRAGADSIIVKVILGLIILSFLFAGVGSYLIGGSDKPVAVIGNVEIGRNQFEQAYQTERQRMQEQVGDIFNSLIADPTYQIQFRTNVLDRMINQALLDQYAERIGLRVSDERVKNEIRSMAAFLNNGIFNNEQYLAALRRNGLSPEQFAEYIRQDLVRQQLIEAIQGSEFALNSELATLYKLEEQTRTVRSITLEREKFAKAVKLTQEEKETYYKENASLFMRPEQFKISYIELSGESLAENIKVTEQEAKQYYETNLARYGASEQRKVRHIMLEGSGDEPMQKAQSLLNELKNGADFATLAKANSQDTFSAENGGELDWFDKGVMDAEFEKAAFSLTNKGDLSSPVQSEFGVHIIRLDDIKPSDTKPFSAVKAEILVQLKEQKAAENFYNLSTTLAEKAFEMPDNLDEAAKAVELSVKSTDFTALTELNGVLANNSVRQALQQQDVREGLNSEVIELSSEHVVVLRIDDSRPEIVLPFAEVEDEVSEKLSNEKGEEAMLELADKLIAELKAGKNDALNASSYKFSQASQIKRNDENRTLADLAFIMTLPEKGSAYRHTRSMQGDLLLVALDKVTEPKLENVDLVAQMGSRVEQSLANVDLLALVAELKQQIKISNELPALEQ